MRSRSDVISAMTDRFQLQERRASLRHLCHRRQGFEVLDDKLQRNGASISVL